MHIYDKSLLFWVSISFLFIHLFIISNNAYGAVECGEPDNTDHKNAIGRICSVEKNAACIQHEQTEEEYWKIRENSPLFFGDKIDSNPGSKFQLLFPDINCNDTDDEYVYLKIDGAINIKIAEKNSKIDMFLNFIGMGGALAHVKAKSKRINNLKSGDIEDIYLKTKKIKIKVIGSDFLIMETEHFSIIMINDHVTALEVEHLNCGGIHFLEEIGQYKFTDDCEMIYQKKTGEEIKQILRELDMMPSEIVKDENMPKQLISDVQNDFANELHESIAGEEYKPEFPALPPDLTP